MNHDQMVACATVGGVAIGGLALSCMTGSPGTAPGLPLRASSVAGSAASTTAVGAKGKIHTRGWPRVDRAWPCSSLTVNPY